MKNSLAILLLFTLLTSCKTNNKKEYVPLPDESKEVAHEELATHPGKKLMQTHCYVCHSPTATEENRIAPPMIAIKKHYINEGTTKEEFINTMINWVKGPSEGKSKMPGAVRRFGVMPYQPFPEQTIRQISDYMYDHDIEEPEWFGEHYRKQYGKGKYRGRGMGGCRGQLMKNDSLDYGEIGLEYALSTKAELGKNLMGTIQKKGTTGAVEFCNIRALPITDSMATVQNAKIKRVSDKPRNPANQANEEELAYIETFKRRVASGKEVNPIIKTENNTVYFYYPITTNTMCLQCHGKPEQMEPQVVSVLHGLYPSDKAKGYNINEVRGIWSITFDKNVIN